MPAGGPSTARPGPNRAPQVSTLNPRGAATPGARRKIAFNSRRSMHSLLIEGADVVAAKYEERHGAPISLDKSAAPLPAEPVAQDK